MNVAEAKIRIGCITKLCDEINAFDEKHQGLTEETGFLCDTIGYLCDYKRTLEKAIEKAELNI